MFEQQQQQQQKDQLLDVLWMTCMHSLSPGLYTVGVYVWQRMCV